ncbi:MAG: 3-deoxy-D-manno-octulosonic acid transferase [Desulfobacterales bacterium]|nr:3-deoxy-D-manno-octulosonic acid transferase [Desulfobacterales bacterium]
MNYTNSLKATILLYNCLWKLIIPLLKFNKRLQDGFEQRTLKINDLPKSDVWIQAASAGEAYLALDIIKNFNPENSLKIYLTTNTKQGFELINKGISAYKGSFSVKTGYFPFDAPSLMEIAVKTIKPKLMILLETEIWPGLLYSLKKSGIKTVIINGRITEQSLKGYTGFSSLLKQLAPNKILAISDGDKFKFEHIFGQGIGEVMSNIKFDRVGLNNSMDSDKNPLKNIIPDKADFIVLASIRQEEELLVHNMILEISSKYKDLIIGLFPRHMERINQWESLLNKSQLKWTLRSKINSPTSNGTIILWDKFGELNAAYNYATAAFVGGSLLPLGGQNFLEPLTCGITPVIGPFWENFAWIGREIIEKKLVLEAPTWSDAVELIINNIKNIPQKELISKSAFEYLKEKQGGTLKAVSEIKKFLNKK